MRNFVLAMSSGSVALMSAMMATGAQADDLRDAVEQDYPYIEKLYKHFHANPELSFRESESAKRIATELEALGFDITSNVGRKWTRKKAKADAGEVMDGVDGYGLIAVLENGDGPTLLIRADMDALPLEEKTGVSYASKVVSQDYFGQEAPVMHACGHDVHMTVLVGTARQLVEMKDQWSGTLVLVGQPAEELGLGALAMIDDGLFSRIPQPDHNIALHVTGLAPAGTIAYTSGNALASVDTVDVTIKGVGGHGAYPHLAVDPILIGSRIVTTLQSIVAREVNPLEAGVITVGSFQGGYKHNIIPDEVTLKLTVRSYEDSVRDKLLDGIRRTAKAQAISAGLPEDLHPVVTIEEDNLISTYNEPGLASRVASTLEARFGQARVRQVPPAMGGEDFAYFGKTDDEIPSLIFWLGGADPEAYAKSLSGEGPRPPSNHSPFFAPVPEPTLTTGVEAMTAAALDLLDGSSAEN